MNHLKLKFILLTLSFCLCDVVDAQYQLFVDSPDDNAAILKSPGGTLGEGPLLFYECDYNATTYNAVTGMIVSDNTRPFRNNSLELRSPLNGRINFFINPAGLFESDLKMTIRDNGDVGIGEADPLAQLHINSDLDDVVLMERMGGNLGEGPVSRFRSEYNSTTYDAVVAMIPNDNNKPHRNNSIELRSPLNGRFNFFVNPTNVNPADLKMTIVDNGNVGIGLIDPLAKLEVRDPATSEVRTSVSSTNYGKIQYTSAEGLRIESVNSGVEFRPILAVGKELLVHTGTGVVSEAMRVTSSGDVGIGNVMPSAKVHVEGSTDDLMKLERIGGTFGEGPLLRYESDYNSTTYQAVIGMIPNDNNKTHRNNSIEMRSPLSGRINFFVNPTNVNASDLKMTIINNGNVGVGVTTPGFLFHVNGTAAKPGGGSWTVASDKRLKKNIQEFSDGMAVVEQIQPVRFQYTEASGMDANKEWIGILAQDMEAIAPYSISSFTAEDGNEYLAFDPSSLDFILINAVKELQSEVRNLKTELSAKGDVSSMSERLAKLEKLILQDQ